MVDDARRSDKKVQEKDPVVTCWVFVSAFFRSTLPGLDHTVSQAHSQRSTRGV